MIIRIRIVSADRVIIYISDWYFLIVYVFEFIHLLTIFCSISWPMGNIDTEFFYCNDTARTIRSYKNRKQMKKLYRVYHRKVHIYVYRCVLFAGTPCMSASVVEVFLCKNKFDTEWKIQSLKLTYFLTFFIILINLIH